MIDYRGNSNACFYVANTGNYNKFYYSLAGNYTNASDTYTTSIDDKWFVDCLININVNN